MKRITSCIIIMVLLLATFQVAYAGSSNPDELTLDQAIARALEHSKKIEKSTKEIDRIKELRDYRNDQLGYTPIGAPDNKLTEMAWASLLTTDLQWRMAKKSLDTDQDTVVLSTCQNYWKVQQAITAVNVAKESMIQSNLDLNKAQASYKVGLIGSEGLLGAETKYNSSKANYAASLNELEKAYAKFNQLMGLSVNARVKLSEDISFYPVGELNLEYEVTRVMETSPTLWLANENVNIQRYLTDMSMYSGEYRPYKARQIELEQARLDAVSAKEATDILTRNLYYELRSIEENYPTVEKNLQLAEESLRVAKIKYQLGMITKSELASAENTVLEAKHNLLKLKTNHAYLKLAFQKPWAYVGTVDQGSR